MLKKLFVIMMASVILVTGVQVPVFGATATNFSLKNVYEQGMFSDIKGTEWYAKSVQKCYELGLMNGKNGIFDANGKVTLAETIATAARAHNIYSGGDGIIENNGAKWYDGAVSYALTNGIIQSGDFTNYNLNATRSQVAYIFANVLPKTEFKVLNYMDWLPDDTDNNIEEAYRSSVYFLYGAGVLTGSDQYGTFNGRSFISRAEAAILITRVVIPSERITFSPDSLIFDGNNPYFDNSEVLRYITTPKVEMLAPAIDYNAIRILSVMSPYDNGSSSPTEWVTKSEGVKSILSVVGGITDASKELPIPSDPYQNAAWVAYAQAEKIIDADDITASNNAMTMTVEEGLCWLVAAVSKFYPRSNDATFPDFSDFFSYDQKTKEAIWIALDRKLIDNGVFPLNLGQQMTKGKMDELLIRTVNTVNIIAQKKVQIKTTDLPKNAKSYPYILSGIDNSVYELPFLETWGCLAGDYAKVPRGIYEHNIDYFGNMDKIIREAYTEILNIDYETITKDHFRNTLHWYVWISGSQRDDLDAYIEYVKQNKIKITGKVTPLLPITYYDGISTRVRTKIEYTIISADTKIDLLFGDRSINGLISNYAPTIYEVKDNTIYVDIPITYTQSSKDNKTVIYFGRYQPLSKQQAGNFCQKTVKLK